MELHRTDIDGVPAIWTPSAGEMHAGLVFRVGRADETLARGGITHLIEHLVLHPVEQTSLHFNGATSPRTTTFYLHGDATEITDFFGTVCRGLRELPADRLDTEKAVLRTEAAGRSNEAVEQMLTWRYGPVGYGLPAFSEFGLSELTADDLRTWIETRFTRGNAVMWISGGPPPADLRIDLPDGPRIPMPPASSALPRLPAYFNTDTNGMALDAIVPRSVASTVYAHVLDRRLFTRLRRELGISYKAHAGYEPRDTDTATITALADALPDQHAAVCREFVNLVIDLAQTEIPADELADVRERARRSIFDPTADLSFLVASAENLLVGLPVRTRDETWERISRVTPADIAEVGQRVLDTALAMLPRRQAIGRAGFTAAPTGSATAIDGTACLPVNDPESKRRLVVGDDGLSLTEGLSIATVKYADCEAMLGWPDGARLLFGADAVAVRVEPELWTLPTDTVARIDAAIPDDRTVRMVARKPTSIPRPPEPVAATFAAPIAVTAPVSMNTASRRWRSGSSWRPYCWRSFSARPDWVRRSDRPWHRSRWPLFSWCSSSW